MLYTSKFYNIDIINENPLITQNRTKKIIFIK